MSFPKPERFPVYDQAISLRSRALGHPARLNILRQLSRRESMCVRDLHTSIPLSQTAVSAHLETLRRVGFITVREDGLYNYYSLNEEALRIFREGVSGFLADVSK